MKPDWNDLLIVFGLGLAGTGAGLIDPRWLLVLVGVLAVTIGLVRARR